MISFDIRKANIDDYYFIYEVKKEVYKKYVEMYFDSWNEQQQKEYFKVFFEKYKNDCYIIMSEDIKIGFYNYSILEDKIEIGNICILPIYQNNGIGTKILSDIIFKNQNKDIYLQYFKNNPVGKLYERFGFKIIEETQYHFKMIKKQNI